jgi:putative (di)nucleoside polyphosphate hydrolase
MPHDRQALPYRLCVGIMLMNAEGRVFVGKRIDSPDAWQMPQGGIDEGETPQQAAMRELGEEVGCDRAVILGETAGWLDYDLPDHLLGRLWGGRYRGQRQKWVACRFTGQDCDINIKTAEPEFDAWQWVPADALLTMIVPFKRATYAAVLQELGHFIQPLRQSPSNLT